MADLPGLLDSITDTSTLSPGAHPLFGLIGREVTLTGQCRLETLLFGTAPSHPPVTKAYADCTYLTYPDTGVEICIDKKPSPIFSAIHISNSAFFASLPYGIAMDWPASRWIQHLGEPEKKAKPAPPSPVWAAWVDLGLKVTFKATDWEDPHSLPSEIILFHPGEW